MKTLKSTIAATAVAAITCTSIAVQGREEELRFVPKNVTLVSADCFDSFLRSLKKINAIIYIPDSKIHKGNELNLIRVQQSTKPLNLANYFRVQPVEKKDDECNSSVKVDFDNLDMIIYVEKSRLADLPALNLHKVEGKFDNLFPKVEQTGKTKTFPKMGDKVVLKFEGKFAEFSQVELKWD